MVTTEASWTAALYAVRTEPVIALSQKLTTLSRPIRAKFDNPAVYGNLFVSYIQDTHRIRVKASSNRLPEP